MVTSIHELPSARTRLQKLRVMMNKPIGVTEFATRGQVILGFVLMVSSIIAFCFSQYMTSHDTNLRMEIAVESLRAQVNSQAGMIAEMHNKQSADHDIIVSTAGDVREVKNWAYSGQGGVNEHRNR